VAFVASLTGDHDGGAVLRWVDGEIETLLLSSDALPGTGGGTAPFNVGHRLTMDAQGRVSFRASVVGGSGVGGIFRLSTEGHEPIALEGQAAPGAAGSYDHLFVQPAMSADGRVAFAAVLSGGASGSAFFAGDGVHTRTVAASLDPLPGTGGGYLAQAQGPIGVSPNGRIGFEGIIFSGSANRGLFLATPPAPPAVPALPPFAAAALVLGLAGWGARLRRRVGRRSPSARPASCR
jgi:hypothetical protein